MKSIRLSLLFYFLGLLALALGTAAVLAYQTSLRALQAKKALTDKLIVKQYEENSHEEEARRDKGLRSQVFTLARMVQVHHEGLGWPGRTQIAQTAGGAIRLPAVVCLLSCPTSPNAPLLAPVWAASVRGPLYYEAVLRRNLADLRVIVEQPASRPEDPMPHGEEQQPEYVQVDSATGSSYCSPSLGGQRLPLDVGGLPSDQAIAWRCDDVTLDNGVKVRRILLKTPLVMGRFPPSPRQPSLFVQCASDVRRLDPVLKKFQQTRDQELAAQEEETATALAQLRNRLLLIGSLTFLATIGGSFWLVRLGLSPLHRLSDAVSRISPRDFQLLFCEPRLPRELQPIVQRLQGTLDLLKRAFAREKQATADISHELRTPLAVLLTTTELALRKTRSAEEYRELLRDCHLSAQQMNQIVQRLLTLARLDAGVDQLHRRWIDLALLTEECAALVRPLAEARGLKLGLQVPDTLPLEADPDKLREVVNNLLHNAIQYNRPQGRIDLRLSQQEEFLQIEVCDTGIGIGPEALGQIFERFYRADPSRGGDDLHAGLGLALVKEYVDLMGGTIAVQSVVGQGSTFRVRLPRSFSLGSGPCHHPGHRS